MPESERLIAACGLDCTDCDMRQAATDPELQRRFATWFKEKRNLDVEPETIRCSWCKGDRSDHWSPGRATLESYRLKVENREVEGERRRG